MMQPGDKVQVKNEESWFFGRTGTIVEKPEKRWDWLIKFDITDTEICFNEKELEVIEEVPRYVD